MDAEQLQANVSGLTEEQVAAIVTLSTNEMATQKSSVTAEVTGSIYQNLDNDMSELGFVKPDGKKSYDHIKEVVGKLKADSASVSGLKSRIKELEAEIAKGGSDELAKQIKGWESKFNDVNTQLEAERRTHIEDKEAAEKALLDYKLNVAVSSALVGVKFKAGVGERMQQLSVMDAKAEVLKDKTLKVDEMGEVTFYDANGVLITNPKNLNKPYTMKELLLETASMKEVVDGGKVVTGTGGKGGDGHVATDTVDISDCKTQVEADEKIANYLFSKGVPRYSSKFDDELVKLRTELGVDKLKLFN